jgi:hypothetical protein
MSTRIDKFREICDEKFGASAGQEHEDVDGKPFMYRYDFCAHSTPCSIAITYGNYMLVGCVQNNGYTFARKTRCTSERDIYVMIAQIYEVQFAVVEPSVYPIEDCKGPDYDYIGTWDARRNGLQIDDYLRVNEHMQVCQGPGYVRMPLEQMSPVEGEKRPDVVNAPEHYSWLGNALAEQVENVGDVEVFHVLMAAFDKDPLLWQVGKYLLRAGRKDDRKQDLEKARWYLDKAIEC